MARRPGGQWPEGQETHGQEANGQQTLFFSLFWSTWKSTMAMQLFWFASNHHLNLPSHSSSEYSYPKHAISIITDGSHASTVTG